MEPTQGPYTVEHGSKGQLYVVGPNSDSMICEVPRLHPRADANAALLAASWEMKEALQLALDPCMGIYAHQNQLGDRCACYECTKGKMVAALAKATQIT